jgi:phosphoglycerol transferase MdoB-like AlkP superfamily enzyme
VVFLTFNFSEFRPINLSQTLKAFLFGVRFDWAVIYYCNFLFILLSLLSFKFTYSNAYQRVLKYLFVIVNLVLIGLNIIDIGYFPIIKRRSGWDMLQMLFTSPETLGLLKSYLLGYWYLFVVWLLFIVALFKFFPEHSFFILKPVQKRLRAFFLTVTIVLLIGGGFAIARGMEGKPLRLISANDYVSPKYVSLLLNTPFSVLNTMGHTTLQNKEYMSFEEVDKLYSSVHRYHNSEAFKPKNVVIIILESFSHEYVSMKTEDNKSFTPFLDSLISEGLFCSNAIANGYNSRDALPAIIGGFASHRGINLMGSRYSTNKVRGLPLLLSEMGYQTSFFHGGHNGTMSFDKFSKLAGIEDYYGYNEYVSDVSKEGDDGAWGIYDSDFLAYMAQKLDEFQEPFFSAVFTLSSHDPYPIPKKYWYKFPKGDLPILESVAYTDYSLRLMFEKMRTKSWYKNTLFVFVADHTSLSLLPEYKTQKANASIPILFYAPSDSSLKGTYPKIAQQTDIMPTVLDYLNYNKSFVAFGSSLFDDTYRFAVNYKGTNYQIVDSTYTLLFDGEKTHTLYNYKADVMHKNNLLNTPEEAQVKINLETLLKAYVQDYESRMVYNNLSDTLSVFELDK